MVGCEEIKLGRGEGVCFTSSQLDFFTTNQTIPSLFISLLPSHFPFPSLIFIPSNLNSAIPSLFLAFFSLPFRFLFPSFPLPFPFLSLPTPFPLPCFFSPSFPLPFVYSQYNLSTIVVLNHV